MRATRIMIAFHFFFQGRPSIPLEQLLDQELEPDQGDKQIHSSTFARMYFIICIQMFMSAKISFSFIVVVVFLSREHKQH